MLGDSVVVSAAVPHEESFHQIVARDLGTGVEIVPAGVGSWNTRTEREWLAAVGLEAVRPDLVLLVAVSNDVEPKLDARNDVDEDRLARELAAASPARSRVRNVALRSALYRSVRQVTAGRRAASRMSRFLEPGSASREDAERALRSLVADTRRSGAEVVVVLYADPANAEAEPFTSFYRAILDELGVEVLVVPAEIHAPRWRVSATDRHLAAAGHRELARWLGPELARRVGEPSARRR